MNEQIQKFAEQAGFNFRVDCATDDEMVRIYQTADKVEKLAELLIKECIAQCNKNDPRPDRYSDWEEFAESRKVRECITSIKEHFGVEE